MTDTPPVAPKPSLLLSLVEAVKELIPALALSVALMIMLWVAIPQANHDPVNIIIGGFLGFITGRATKPPARPAS